MSQGVALSPLNRGCSNQIASQANLIFMAPMRIVSVNVGQPREVIWKHTQVTTSIFKQAVEGPVDVKKLNLNGDRQSDLTVHGGPDKAIYAYPSEHYAYWRAELPEVEFPWGTFGENLTTEGLLEDALHIGDQLRVGTALLVVRQPRVPCYKLTIRFDRDDMIKRFIASHTSGFYFGVLEEGELAAGSPIEIVHRDRTAVSVADINRLYYGDSDDAGLLRRAVSVEALPAGWRDHLWQKVR
jgi:MOSC domain-containing protein YiiM